MAPQPEEGFLGDIFRFRKITEETISKADNRSKVAVDQNSTGRRITVPGTAHQRGFIFVYPLTSGMRPLCISSVQSMLRSLVGSPSGLCEENTVANGRRKRELTSLGHRPHAIVNAYKVNRSPRRLIRPAALNGWASKFRRARSAMNRDRSAPALNNRKMLYYNV
jgi:hypothetical protein